MFESLVSTLRFLFAFVSALLSASDAGTLGVAAVVVAVVVAIAVVLAVTRSTPALRSGPHPRRAIDASSPLAQSDPDAAGHSRSRAPGQAVSAAH